MSGELPPMRKSSDKSCCLLYQWKRCGREGSTHKLAMNVSADGHGTPHRLNIGLVYQNLSSLYEQGE